MLKHVPSSITDLGSVAELALSVIYKHAGTGDVIVIGTEARIPECHPISDPSFS